MACSNDGINILGMDIAIESLSTALSLVTAIVYYNKWKDDKDNLQSLSEQYVAIGEEYCTAADVLRLNTNRYYAYANSLPEYTPSAASAQSKYIGSLGQSQLALKPAYGSVPSDDPGMLCAVRADVAKDIAVSASAAWAEGYMHERKVSDEHLASKVQALTSAVAGSTPNLASAFKLVGDTVSQSAQANYSAFSSALYVTGRGVGNLINRSQGPTVGSY